MTPEDGHPDFHRARRQGPTHNGQEGLREIHALEAEASLLGCVLYGAGPLAKGAAECVAECLERIRPEEVVFYDLRNQTIWEAMVEMFDKRVEIDLVTLSQALKDRQLFEQVGGLDYLARLPDTVPSPSNLSHYLDIVLEKHAMRQLVQTFTEGVGKVYSFSGEDVNTLLDEAERDVLQIRAKQFQPKSKSAKELVQHSIETIEQLVEKEGHLTGISSGFTDYDKLTGGLKDGEMIVIAARPSIGKTSLAMNIAEHVAVEQKLPVGVFSLEMTAEALMLRTICCRARVNLRAIKEGFLAERDLPKLTAAAGKLSAAPLYIDETSGMTILQLRAKARRMFHEHGIKLFAVDYLQLVHPGKHRRREPSRQEEIAEVSGGLKELAKELMVPIIVLCQLNREVEKERHNRKPRLTDLRESGAIEQDADEVGLLYEPKNDQDDEGGQKSEAQRINWLIAKQRNGPRDEDVHLTFLKCYTRFEMAAKIHEADVPPDMQGTMI